MGGLITVSELATAMKTTFTPAQMEQAESYIDDITAYIEGQADTYFSLHEGESFKWRANAYGRIKIPVAPVIEVTTVHDWTTDVDITTYLWDGDEYIYALYGGQLVTVTLTYGMDSVPADIKALAKSACKRGMGNAASNLKSKQVGEVIYEFGDMLPFTDWEQKVIDDYSESMGTFNTSERSFAPDPYLDPLIVNRGNYDPLP